MLKDYNKLNHIPKSSKNDAVVLILLSDVCLQDADDWSTNVFILYAIVVLCILTTFISDCVFEIRSLFHDDFDGILFLL